MGKTFKVTAQEEKDFSIENGIYEVTVSAVDDPEPKGEVMFSNVNYKLDDGREVRYDYISDADNLNWKNSAIARAIGFAEGEELTFDTLILALKKHPRLQIRIKNEANLKGDMYPKAKGYYPSSTEKSSGESLFNTSQTFDEIVEDVSDLWK